MTCANVGEFFDKGSLIVPLELWAFGGGENDGVYGGVYGGVLYRDGVRDHD